MLINPKLSLFHGYIEDYKDALVVIEASRLGYLSLIKRRLNSNEKKLIIPGACFVWEESSSSMCRWTDGKSWSKSRYYKGFFSYYERTNRNNKNNDGYSNLIKRTYTIQGIDDRKFQLVNYVHNNKSKHCDLLRPRNSSLKQLDIPENYYFKKDVLEVKKLTSDNEASNASSLYKKDDNINSSSNSNSPLPHSLQETFGLTTSSYLLECPIDNTLRFEDKKIISLFEIKL